MANVDVSAVANALAIRFEDKIASQWNRSVVATQLLPFKPGEGQNIQWDVEDVDGAPTPSNSAIADGGVVNTFNDDTVEPAVLQWGTYSESFAVTGKALAVAAAAGSPSALVDLFGDRLDRAAMRLANSINSEIYGGSGAANHIAGLTATNGGLRATGTYAGIDRSVRTLWAGNELTNGGVPRALSLKLMRDARKAVYLASGEMPDLILCDPTQHENYGQLLGDARRYFQDVRIRGQRITLDGGYNALEFDGIPVVADRQCPSGTMLFINTSHVYVRQLPDALGSLPNGIGRGGVVRLHGTPEEQLGAGSTSLTARINPLAVQGDLYSFQLIMYPQIQVRRPNANCMLGDLL